MFQPRTGLFLVLVTAMLLSPVISADDFSDYVVKNRKTYATEIEEKYRSIVYSRNKADIERNNRDPTSLFIAAENQFTDLTVEEFRGMFLNNPITQEEMDSFAVNASEVNFTDPVPESGISSKSSTIISAPGKDWRTTVGVVPPIENQGSCGSCYAFSAIGALESAMKIKGKPSLVYSKQQTVSCCGTKGFKCGGCKGGWMWWVYNYINSWGIVTQTAYPYTSGSTGQTGVCKSFVGAVKVLNTVIPYSYVTKNNVTALKNVVSKQPVSVGVDAGNWNTYGSGIFPASSCSSSPNAANHAVVLVGFEPTGTWIVRNSWGVGWGMNGYMRLQAGNSCGVTNYGIIPNVV